MTNKLIAVLSLPFLCISLSAQDYTGSFTEYTSFKKGNFNTYLGMNSTYFYTFGSEQKTYKRQGSRKSSFITKYNLKTMEPVEKIKLGKLKVDGHDLAFIGTLFLNKRTSILFSWHDSKMHMSHVVYCHLLDDVSLSDFKNLGTYPELVKGEKFVDILYSADSNKFALHAFKPFFKDYSEGHIAVYDDKLKQVWEDDLNRLPTTVTGQLHINALDYTLSNAGDIYIVGYEKIEGKSARTGNNTEKAIVALYKASGPNHEFIRHELTNGFYYKPSAKLLIEDERHVTVAYTICSVERTGKGEVFEGIGIKSYDMESFGETSSIRVSLKEEPLSTPSSDQMKEGISREIKGFIKKPNGEFYALLEKVRVIQEMLSPTGMVDILSLSASKKLKRLDPITAGSTNPNYIHILDGNDLLFFYQDWLVNVYTKEGTKQMGYNAFDQGLFVKSSATKFKTPKPLMIFKHGGLKFKMFYPHSIFLKKKQFVFFFYSLNNIKKFWLGSAQYPDK